MTSIEFDFICFICFAIFGLVIGIIVADIFFKKLIIRNSISVDIIYFISAVISIFGFMFFEVLGKEALPYVSILFVFCAIGMIARTFIISHSHGMVGNKQKTAN